MVQRCRISHGTTVQLQSSDSANADQLTDITEHAQFLMQLGSTAPSDPQETTVETGLSLVASEQARFYLNGKRLSAAHGLTMVADGLRYVLKDALLRLETRPGS